MPFLPGKSGNPNGSAGTKPLTNALISRLNWSEDEKEKPRTVAQAIVEKLISNALLGDQRSIEMIFDRVEGKATQVIEQTTKHEVMDVVEAARRIAFAINSAKLDGVQIEGEFARLVPPEYLEPPVQAVELPPVKMPKSSELGRPLSELTKQQRKEMGID
ncbi:MAG: hypothetical protein EB117_09075 [Betaproteobacteria bacterium]|nr:hypothetical protein [Betaproteobacteria bacterium]